MAEIIVSQFYLFWKTFVFSFKLTLDESSYSRTSMSPGLKEMPYTFSPAQIRLNLGRCIEIMVKSPLEGW